MASDFISIQGAREHNLRGVNLDLPKNRLVVFTGLSGSGKSSLAFDTLFAEGQRLYVESLSPYARQFMRQLPRPRVDRIDGLRPAIAIQQGLRSHNPRSTVATITEILDYLRVLYATIGQGHCPQCGRPLQAQSRQVLLDQVRALNHRQPLQILAPVVTGRRGQFRELFIDLLKRGYARARVDGEMISLASPPTLDRYRRHDIEIVVDRLPRRVEEPGRLAETVDDALERGEGSLLVLLPSGEQVRLSSNLACPDCGVSLPEMTPASFSFNSPRGMCPTCEGIGVCKQIDPELLVAHPDKSLNDGAISFLYHLMHRRDRRLLQAVAKRFRFSLDKPWSKLTERQQELLLNGSPEEIHWTYRSSWGRDSEHSGPWEGIIPWLLRRNKRILAGPWRMAMDKVMRDTACPACRGKRLCPDSLAVTLGGKHLAEVLALTVSESCCTNSSRSLAVSVIPSPGSGWARARAPHGAGPSLLVTA